MSSGLGSSDLAGRSVTMHVSLRVCNTCRQGHHANGVPDGIFRQFSNYHPDLAVRVSNAQTSEILIFKNGEVTRKKN